MRKEFKNRIAWSIITTLVIYLMMSFIKWDILIIKQLSEAVLEVRLAIVLLFISKEAVLQIIVDDLPKIIK
jgi:hypothetical protein